MSEALSQNKPSVKKELTNVILLSLASGGSLFGTSIYNFAIGLYVLKLTGSGLSFATTLVISVLSTVLVNPFAGVLADRVNKKLLAVFTDAINGFIMISLYLLTMKYSFNLPMIYVSTVFLNISSAVYGISIEAARPDLVSEKRLLSVNSINKVIDASSSIFGPMAGGIIFALFEIRYFIILNGLSFAISALLQLFIDFKFNCRKEDKEKEKVHFLTDFIGGINYFKTRKNIIDMFVIFISLNFFIGLSINVPMPFIINNVLKLNSGFFGIIEAAFPVGMIFGALMIKSIMRRYSYSKIIKASNILLSVCMAAIGFSVILRTHLNNEIVFLIYFVITMTLAGIAVTSIDLPIFFTLQQTIPEDFRGRVLSIGISIAKVILPVALIIAGALINHIPPCLLPIVSGAGLGLFSMLFIKNDSLRFNNSK